MFQRGVTGLCRAVKKRVTEVSQSQRCGKVCFCFISLAKEGNRKLQTAGSLSTVSTGRVPHPKGQQADQVGGALEGRTRRGTRHRPHHCSPRDTRSDGQAACRRGQDQAVAAPTSARRGLGLTSQQRSKLDSHHLVIHGARWTRRKGEPWGSGETLRPPHTLPPGSLCFFPT